MESNRTKFLFIGVGKTGRQHYKHEWLGLCSIQRFTDTDERTHPKC